MRNMKLNDNVFLEDKSNYNSGQTLWAKTQVQVGYGLTTNDKGISQLNEVVFDTTNMVPLVGVQYAMETIFGIKGPLSIPVLNQTDFIGAQASTIKPSGGNPYAYGQKVCLFGIGIGGAAENNTTVIPVKYSDTNVSTQIPFRLSDAALSAADAAKYFGKKVIGTKTAYYLKKFDNDPVIKHLYDDREGLEDGTELTNDYFASPAEYDVQSFTEILLTINKEDVKEWFNETGNIEEARVNSIGLYTAIYDDANTDYAQIQLFSKLNIQSEPLAVAKDMHIIYRVYAT